VSQSKDIERDDDDDDYGERERTEGEVAADEEVQVVAARVGALAEEPPHDVDLPQGLERGEVVDVVGDVPSDEPVALALERQALVVLVVDLHPFITINTIINIINDECVRGGACVRVRWCVCVPR
jgi:hypothetical protein